LNTFLDSGVLLHAWRGDSLAAAALKILSDDTRSFFSSQFIRLELLPKPAFEKRKTEVEFYNTHFTDCENIAPLTETLGNEAEKLASRYGLTGPDALQIAAAIQQGAEEFYTSEKPGKPMFRVKELKVISLYSLA
jgi:predicted nucleic acid-binding protein